MEIEVKCPKCGETIKFEFRREMIHEKDTSFVYIPVVHGSPPHVLVVMVSPEGKVYGTAVYNSLVSIYGNVADVIKILGLETFARLLTAAIVDEPIKLLLSADIYQLLAGVINFLGLRFRIDKNAKVGYNQATKKFTGSIPGEKYIISNLKKIIKRSKDSKELADNVKKFVNDTVMLLLDIEHFLKKLPEQGINLYSLLARFKITDKKLQELVMRYVENKGLRNRFYEFKPF